MIILETERLILREISFEDFQELSETLEKIRKNLEEIMVRQVREMDGEFNLFHVEQDLTAHKFKQDIRDARAARKAAKKSKRGK